MQAVSHFRSLAFEQQLVLLWAAKPRLGRESDPTVLLCDEYLYGMRARVNAGFGIWMVHTLEIRDDGIWGLVNWSSEGREKIAGRVYRYISPLHQPGVHL